MNQPDGLGFEEFSSAQPVVNVVPAIESVFTTWNLLSVKSMYFGGNEWIKRF